MPILSKDKRSKTKSHLPGFFPLMSLILKQNMTQQIIENPPTNIHIKGVTSARERKL